MYTTREAAYDTVHDAQRHFRVLLDAMARPGTLAHLQADHLQPPADLHRASALVGLAPVSYTHLTLPTSPHV